MKVTFRFRGWILFATLSIAILVNGCNDKTAGKNNDQAADKSGDSIVVKNTEAVAEKNDQHGYTGEIKDSRAAMLIKKCHFISSDLINEWTARYQKYKKRNTREKLPDIGTLLGDSASFNSCIIRTIIGNPKSIGLRVVYGMSEDKKIHVIFVGVNPDYSSLYIKEKDACCGSNGAEKSSAAAPPANKLGGAEYGQMP